MCCEEERNIVKRTNGKQYEKEEKGVLYEITKNQVIIAIRNPFRSFVIIQRKKKVIKTANIVKKKKKDEVKIRWRGRKKCTL